MAYFPIKNENSSCEVSLFCQNKVPNQFPIFVMKYAYGSRSLKFNPPVLTIQCIENVTVKNEYAVQAAASGKRPTECRVVINPQIASKPDQSCVKVMLHQHHSYSKGIPDTISNNIIWLWVYHGMSGQR